MTDAQENIFMILLGFIAVLLGVVIYVVIYSQIKKDKTKDSSAKKIDESHSLAGEAERESPHDKTFVSVEAQEKTFVPVDPQEKTYVPEANLPSGIEVEPDLQTALRKTEENFFGRIRRAFLNSDKKVVLEAVEEILYTSDLGPTTVQKLLEVVEAELSGKEMTKIESVKAALKDQMITILKPVQPEVATVKVADLVKRAASGPTVLMIVGVNGAGKTTSIGKISAQLASQNFKVLVAAGDTFRAAAGGQLKTWTDRAGQQSAGEGSVEIYWPENTTDPSAVAFDALTRAKSQNTDFVILDTAGRLHTQSHLMDELKKVKRVMAKVIPEAPHETWIVLDANSGQNALAQAKEFNQALGLTGLILTKMDGTAKGGVALGVVDQLNIPIKLVGIGEKINHLKSFNYVEYIDSILGHG